MRNRDDLTFSMGEYERRLARVRARMAELELDALLVNGPENLTYLTGYQTTGYYYMQALVVPLVGEPFMVTRLLEDTNVVARTWLEKSRPYADTESAMNKLCAAIREADLHRGRVGYERDAYFLRAFEQDALRRGLPDAVLVDASGLVEAERVVKSEEEIALLRRVARVTEVGIEAGLAASRVGATENEVAAEIHHAMFRAGGEYPACSPFVASGPRCAIGHATWEGRRIAPEEYVFIEVAGCIQRYHAAAMRMAYTGELSAEVRAVEAKIREAVEACMAEMKPGTPASRIDAVSREILADNPFGAQQSTRVGYSMGVAYAPDWGEGGIFSLQGDNHRPLEANMVFHLIPWIQIPGKAGIGLSETVRVTPGGGESLFRELPPAIRAVSRG